MRVSVVQAVLSILVVGISVIVGGIVTLAPVLGGYPPGEYLEHLKAYGSLNSGVVGLVLGYYFGKAKADEFGADR